MVVNENGWKGVNDSHCNGNKVEWGKQQYVGQNASRGFTRFYLLLDQEIQSEKHYGRIVGSQMWILVHQQMYSGWNESFSKIYIFQLNDSNLGKKITGLSFAKGLSINQSEWNPIGTYNYPYYDWWELIVNRQYIIKSINRASTMFCLVSQVLAK